MEGDGVSAPYCAECGEHVAPDSDHIHVEAEARRMDDRNETETFYFHRGCWWDVSDDWEVPA
jgi:hypothetical protein